MASGVPFGKIADFIQKLDKAAADGSSHGTLKIRGDFEEVGTGEWGVAGHAALSDDLAKFLELLPVELRGEIGRLRDWALQHAIEIDWEFGKKA